MEFGQGLGSKDKLPLEATNLGVQTITQKWKISLTIEELINVLQYT
jgi:hypothetical protein